MTVPFTLLIAGTLMQQSSNYGFFHSGALLQAIARMSKKASTISTRSDLVNKVIREERAPQLPNICSLD